MAVVFRPVPPDPDEDEVFDNGERVPDVLIRTQDLPRHFPTERFAPQRGPGGYHIRVDLTVAPGTLFLRPAAQRGQPVVPAERLSYSVFAAAGLPLELSNFDPQRGFVQVAGRLWPVVVEREASPG
jgi:hypothetical protein